MKERKDKRRKREVSFFFASFEENKRFSPSLSFSTLSFKRHRLFISLSPELMQLDIGTSIRRYAPPIGTAGLARCFVNG